jgi:hemerythrin
MKPYAPDPLNIPSLDNHHADVFKMIHLLDTAIKTNSRAAFEPIINFLTQHATDHFNEEEMLMEQHKFYDLAAHRLEHQRFKNKINHIKKMYTEQLHTTHIAYSIRQLIDALIIHIQTIDIKMKDITNAKSA